MSILDRIRQLLQTPAIGSSNLPQGEVDIQRRLYINYAIVDPKLCTSQQASAFYGTLDDIQQFLDDLKKIENMEDYESWFASLNVWTRTNWAQFVDDPCDGIAFLIYGLHALIRHFAIEALTGRVERIPAYSVLDVAQSMAETDSAAIKNNEDPETALEINRVVADLPLCSEERATQFHKTIDGFQAMTEAMLETDWGPSLKEWLQYFHAWRREAWGTFYERPCGVTLSRMYELESKIYLAALMHVTGIEQADQVSGLSKATEEWWNAAIKDKTTLMDASNRP